MSSVMRNRKDKESKRHYRNEGSRNYQPSNYRPGNDITERQREDDKRSNKSTVNSSGVGSGNLTKTSGSSDSFTADDRREAKKELERIQRRIAELKGTRMDDEDEDNDNKEASIERFVFLVDCVEGVGNLRHSLALLHIQVSITISYVEFQLIFQD